MKRKLCYKFGALWNPFFSEFHLIFFHLNYSNSFYFLTFYANFTIRARCAAWGFPGFSYMCLSLLLDVHVARICQTGYKMLHRSCLETLGVFVDFAGFLGGCFKCGFGGNFSQMMVNSMIFNLFNNSYCFIARLSRTVEPYQPSLCSVSWLTPIFFGIFPQICHLSSSLVSKLGDDTAPISLALRFLPDLLLLHDPPLLTATLWPKKKKILLFLTWVSPQSLFDQMTQSHFDFITGWKYFFFFTLYFSDDLQELIFFLFLSSERPRTIHFFENELFTSRLISSGFRSILILSCLPVAHLATEE